MTPTRDPADRPITVAVRKVYSSRWWTVEEHDVVEHDGYEGMYNVLRCADGVSVLAMDRENVFLIREYKHAVGRHMLQLPSGSIDVGETPLQAAQRELIEETGLVADTWTELGMVHPYPTNVADAVHLFVAQDVRLMRPSERGIAVLRVAAADVRALIDHNEITHAASLVCLLRHL